MPPALCWQGTIVYSFPRSFRSDVSTRSLLLRLRPLWLGAQKAAAYLTRVLFGTALVASIFIVWLAVVVILSGKGDRDNDRCVRLCVLRAVGLCIRFMVALGSVAGVFTLLAI